MADDQIRMPSSGAGITTFYEESKSKVVVSPYAVIGAILVVIVIVALLNSIV